MPTTCHGTLKVYGDPVHADRARDRIAAIFGPPLRNDANPFLKSEPENPPLLVVRTESRVVPPVTLVAELSEQEPELVFELLYSNGERCVQGTRVYKNGKLTHDEQSPYFVEELLADDDPTVAIERRQQPGLASQATEQQGPINVEPAAEDCVEPESAPNSPAAKATTSSSARAAAKALLFQCYESVFQKIRNGRDDSLFEASWQETGLQAYDALLEVMDEAGQFYCQQLEDQLRLRADRLREKVAAYKALKDLLERADHPPLAALLDADDRVALSSMQSVVMKLSPYHEPEYISDASRPPAHRQARCP